jgi:Type I phosphodiesterase / nucleotide pyrophosphatase
MSLADVIRTRIFAEREARFSALNLPPNFIAPNYGGRSIVNLSASIVRTLGGTIGTAPLDPEILDGLTGGTLPGGPLPGGIRRIVLVILDALGYERALESLAESSDNGFHTLLKAGGRLVPLTSVFPSSTTAALTALWSGFTPAEHGFVGYQLYLREYGARAQMISFNPTATDKLGSEQLLAAGLDPDKFLAVPSLPQTLSAARVPVYNLIEQEFAKSILSRVQIRGQREMFGFLSSSEMWAALRGRIERHSRERALFVAYWSKIDTLSHKYGPSSDMVRAELDNFGYSFEREFLRRLPPAAREGTLFLLTADHGQVDVVPGKAIYMRDHPVLRDHLLMDATGDPRAAYLYARSREADAARDYVEKRLGEQFVVLDSQAALSAGLFGGGVPAPETRFRIGDLILLARGAQCLWSRDAAPKMLGMHGALLPQEMLVPLLAARLDA